MTTLKSETRLHHERLERRTGLTEPDLSLARYQEVLGHFHAVYATLEPLLFDRPEWLALNFDTAARRKLPWLERDLAYFGLSHFRPAPPPTLPTFSHLLGALYVVEGATLGGQLIGRHLERKFGLTRRRGATFFNGYAAATGDHWKVVCDLLTSQAGHPPKDVEIVAGAMILFSHLEAQLAGERLA